MGAGRLLAGERLVGAQPSLVRAVGLAKAVLLQQVHWNVSDARRGEEHDGERWYATSTAEFADEVGLSESAIARALRALEDDGLVVSTQPEGWSSRRKWYRIRYEHPLLCGPSSHHAESSDGAVSHEGDSPRSEEGDSPRSQQGDSPRSSSTRSTRTTNSKNEDDLTVSSSSEKSPRGDEPVAKAGKKRPRRTDPRADGLVREWWEAQTPKPSQQWSAAVGVVSKALGAGWTEDEIRDVLATLDSPLSGARLDFGRSKLRQSQPRRFANDPSEWDRDAEPRVLSPDEVEAARR